MPSNVTYEQVSPDAQVALTEFTDELALALVQDDTNQWAEDIGIVRVSTKLKTKFHVGVSAPVFTEFVGDPRYRQLFQKGISVIPKLWQDGWAELLRIIESDEFIGWEDEPSKMAAAAKSCVNLFVADLIENGLTGTHEFDEKSFFDDDHPINIFDAASTTFANKFTGSSGDGTALTLATLKLAKQYFRQIKAPNGRPLGLRCTHLMVPAALEETAKDLLEQDLVIQAVNGDFGAVDNRHKGTVALVVNDELTDDDAWYPMALNKKGMRPWGIQKRTPGPKVMTLGQDSALYEKERKIGVSAELDFGAALLMPHCIQYWEGTAASP